MVIENYKWTSLHEGEYENKDIVLNMLNADRQNRNNSSFKVKGREMYVQTENKGKSFVVSTFVNGDKRNLKTEGSALNIEDDSLFAELIINYSEELLQSFNTDDDYNLKKIISYLDQETKDEMLFKMMKEYSSKDTIKKLF